MRRCFRAGGSLRGVVAPRGPVPRSSRQAGRSVREGARPLSRAWGRRFAFVTKGRDAQDGEESCRIHLSDWCPSSVCYTEGPRVATLSGLHPTLRRTKNEIGGECRYG